MSSWSAPGPQGAAPTLSGLGVHKGLRLAHQLEGPGTGRSAAPSGPENHSSYPPARVASCLSFHSFCQDAKMPNEHLARAVMSGHAHRPVAIPSRISLPSTHAPHCPKPEMAGQSVATAPHGVFLTLSILPLQQAQVLRAPYLGYRHISSGHTSSQAVA